LVLANNQGTAKVTPWCMAMANAPTKCTASGVGLERGAWDQAKWAAKGPQTLTLPMWVSMRT